MYPILFTIGPLTLKTLTIFKLLAFFSAALVFYRKGKEEHYSEYEMFDGLLLAALVGILVGRVGYIALYFHQFGFNPLNWLDISAHPGVSLWVGVLAAMWYLARFARQHKWDVFEVLDFWSISLTVGLFWWYLGLFFDGTNLGRATNLFWGVTPPNVLEKHHPLTIYWSIFYLLLFIYLAWAESKYRTFSWYRAHKNTAQSGFLISIFTIVNCLALTILTLLISDQASGFWLREIILAIMGVMGGLVMLVRRSGRLKWLKIF